jgi:hypothetical protein
VTIAVEGEDAELTFTPLLQVDEEVEVYPADSQVWDYARASRLAPQLAFRSEEESDEHAALWSAEAIQELLRRLRWENWPHADIIEYAARHGGVVSRADVYEIAGYSPGRMLRGFTRPTRRITLDLISEGMLDENAEWPLLTQYAHGVLASHFVVPIEFRALLA